tara:strand:+ start:5914 stop:6420 length:507 start_codon:yes stop_codon:yes gene_type:complete
MHNDVIILKDKYFEKRGNIYTIFNAEDMPQGLTFVQDKISKSFQGVIRGFHGDNKTWKLITCLHGKVKLITYNLDNNKRSEYILSGDDKTSKAVLVPPRVLNGHQCLSLNCIFYYKWSEFYTGPEDQWSVHYNDITINPGWIGDYQQIISERDINAQSLQELRKYVKS